MGGAATNRSGPVPVGGDGSPPAPDPTEQAHGAHGRAREPAGTNGEDSILQFLAARGISRRAFLRFCGAMAAALALPAGYGPQIAKALSTAPRIPLVWLEGQDCAGNTEGFLRASHPTVAELVLDTLSLNYHETIMAPAGRAAEKSLSDTITASPGQYIAVVEGAVPVAEDGTYCLIAGRTFRSMVEEVCGKALLTITVGTCAFDGGLPAASGGPTGAAGVAAIVPGAKVVNLPGCPMNVQNLTATIVHYLTFGALPATDSLGRPYFAYGQLLHDQCERRAHFDAGEYVLSWGDEGSRKGWCLYKMGCKGPETFANCPTVRFNDRTSWPVKAGHGCVGCTMPRFWDQMSPFYRRLSNPPGFAVDVTADQIGLGLVGAVAALSVAHGTVSYVRARRAGDHEAAGESGPVPTIVLPEPGEPGAGAPPTSPPGASGGGEVS
ncbi:MAG: hydrogenase small subunit [Chloroflexi bacterium]|nr:hydrogenase small subunit [Chloroflexota bacterium]